MNRLVLYIFLLLISWQSVAQPLPDIHEALSRGQYSSAHKSLKKLSTEDKATSTYFFCRARLYSAKKFKYHDYGRAYGNLLEAKRLFKKKGTKFPQIVSKASLRKTQERIEFEWLLALNEAQDLEALSSYIIKYPHAGNRDQAIEIQYDLAYEKAQSSGTPEAYASFRANFPEAPQVPGALRLEHEKAFERATKNNTVEAYKEFISDYPEASQIGRAKQLQDTLLYITILEQDKKIAQAKTDAQQAKLDKRETQQIWLIAGVSVLAISLGLVVFSLTKIRKTNSNLREAHKEITEQKSIIESKNNEIVGSIKYAKYIQNAVLPSSDAIVNAFSDAFIFYQPKDIVSGDFFWFAEIEGKKILAVADCTGHGVPGAFMSMIGHTLLHQIVHKEGVLKTNEILDRLKEEIIDALNQRENSETAHDGMDIAIIVLQGHQLEFSGAHNPGWLFTPELSVLTPDIQPVGKDILGIEKKFTSQSMEVRQGDMIYLFSDGFADQFGGPKEKKFSRNRMQRLFSEIHALPCSEQHSRIGKEMVNWKGNDEQIDDMLIVGIRI